MPHPKRSRNATISGGANVPKRPRGAATQPIDVDAASQLPHYPSPHRAIANASQAIPRLDGTFSPVSPSAQANQHLTD
jgi:hypothetical protein